MRINKILRYFTAGLLTLLQVTTAYALEPDNYGGVDLPITGQILEVPSQYPAIQSAIDSAAAGDTILVSSGVYNESIRFYGKPVNLLSKDGPEHTVISGVGGSTIEAGPGGKIYGFTISNGVAIFGAGIRVRGTGLEIKHNIFKQNRHDVGGFGAAIGGNSASALIENNTFTNNGCDDDQFLSGVVGFVNTSAPRIVNNVFDGNPCRAINFTVPVSARPQVINNTIVRNRIGIFVDRRINSINQVYRNNIVYGNDIGVHMRFGNDSYNPVFENNLVYGNSTDYVNMADQTGQNGNISVDPVFADYAAGDLHLQRTSPAIDAGTAFGAPLTDYDGEPRPFDGNGDGIAAFDIGADEYSSKLTITVTGGLQQECSAIGGNSVEFSAALTLADETVDTVNWSLDGTVVATGETVNIYVPLGAHEISALATTQSGNSYSSSVIVIIEDTIAPTVNAYFIDKRTNEVITTIDTANTEWAITKHDVSDVCDATPVVKVFGGIALDTNDVIKIQGNLNTITLETSQVDLHVQAKDASGNIAGSDASLIITE